MKDTKNLMKKRDFEYPKLIRLAESKGDYDTANYWKDKLEHIKSMIASRFANKKRNTKLYKKAN